MSETIEYENLTITIGQDEDPFDPRTDADELGVMVCWHRYYTLGDRKPTDEEMTALRYGGFEGLEKHLKRTLKAEGDELLELLPLSLLDHSGLHMWVGSKAHWSDAGGWDSGPVGFIYATRKQADLLGVPVERRRVIGVKISPLGSLPIEVGEVEAQLRGEVETYDQYLTGDVYYYTIEDEDGEFVDSLSGMYGFDYCKQEALSAAKHHHETRVREKAEHDAYELALSVA